MQLFKIARIKRYIISKGVIVRWPLNKSQMRRQYNYVLVMKENKCQMRLYECEKYFLKIKKGILGQSKSDYVTSRITGRKY
jgi:hypothetical protein